MADLGKAAKALSRAAAAAAKAAGPGAYKTTRFQFSTGLAGAVSDYLNGENARAARNDAKRLAVEKVFETGERGFRDGSGDVNVEILGDDLSTLVALQNATLAYVDGLFDDLGELKRQDPIVFPQARVDQFTNSLDGVYNTMKLRGAKNPTLEFAGRDGAAGCATCAGLQGRRMPALRWVELGLVPGAGNTNFVCNGFHCQHYLATLDGRRFTV